VVLRWEGEPSGRAPGVHHHGVVLTARRCGRLREVGYLQEFGLQCGLRLPEAGLESSYLLSHHPHSLDLGGGVLLVALGPGDLLAHEVPQTPFLLHREQHLATYAIEVEQGVESGFCMWPPPAQRRADHVRLVPDKSDVEHRDSPR
jgi:hypothetical protein